MNGDRLDQRAVDRLKGPSWDPLRNTFSQVNETLLAVSPTVWGKLATNYIKYAGPETENLPYAVLWVKKGSEMVLGLALPESVETSLLSKPPPGYSYARLTRFLTFEAGTVVPAELTVWAQQAYHAMTNRRELADPTSPDVNSLAPSPTAMNALNVTVTRTWKRDGSTNEMGLDDAVENLARKQDLMGVADTDPADRREAIRRYLLAGRTLRTASATFAIVGLSPTSAD